MCGIFGVVAQNAYDKVIKGLKLLQYRGYDSCGIAYFDKYFKIHKAVGSIEKLKKLDKNITVAFGHTRWATNGVVSLQNAHPHISYDTAVTLVHNGIIKNADTIKNELKKDNIPFYSETDTEVIANYIASAKLDIETTLLSLFSKLEGSFSLIIGTKSGDLYLVKKFSPLNILTTKDGIYISSDISSLPNGKLYSLQDGDVIKISNKQIISLTTNKIKFINHKSNENNYNLDNYDCYMQKEIYETPLAVYNTFKSLKQFDLTILKKYKHFTFIGCGTAFHSCLVGEYFFKNILNYSTECLLASNYEVVNKIKKNHLHIIVSQSGETADCIKVANNIKENNGNILLITNEPHSTLAKIADFSIFTKANKEIAVASTKTYCCQLFVFGYITQKILNNNYSLSIDNFIKNLSVYINNIDINHIAEQLKDVGKLILIGKGIDYLTLLEASLKIREIDYFYTIPIYASELKHGTLSLVDDKTYVLTLNSCYSKNILQNAINEIQSRKGNVINFDCDNYTNIDFCYKPIYAVIPFQLLSYKIAILNRIDPDKPRNLAKSVTVE